MPLFFFVTTPERLRVNFNRYGPPEQLDRHHDAHLVANAHDPAALAGKGAAVDLHQLAGAPGPRFNREVRLEHLAHSIDFPIRNVPYDPQHAADPLNGAVSGPGENVAWEQRPLDPLHAIGPAGLGDGDRKKRLKAGAP